MLELQKNLEETMDAETARTIVNGCATLPICLYRITVLAGGSIFLGPLLIMIGWTDLRHSAITPMACRK